jgi:regulator of sirC expression with transglutaminase-like and TPR domain
VTVPAPSARQEFTREVNRGPDELDLARAALLVAREEYPQLPVERYLGLLDQFAEEVQDRLGGETAAPVILQELRATLYERNRFRGNREAYYDPRNSFLSDVLDRRLGIPLTLGIVVLEVGWRLGLPLEGVNFPGHFLVRHVGEGMNLLLDPFDGGRLRFEDEAQGLLDRVYGGMVKVREDFLRPASRRDMLVRLLTNLKGVYVNVHDHRRALAAVERILVLHPTAPAEIRDRGTLLARMGRNEEALEQLEWYLGYAPEASDAERIRALVDELRGAGGGTGLA